MMDAVPMFKKLNELQIDMLTEVLEPVVFPQGTTIIKKGGMNSSFYILQHGAVSVQAHGEVGSPAARRGVIPCDGAA